MKTIRCGLMGLLMVVLGVFLAGCPAGGGYQKDSEYVPYISDVPATFYDNDSTLRHWYTTPYWHPTSGPE